MMGCNANRKYEVHILCEWPLIFLTLLAINTLLAAIKLDFAFIKNTVAHFVPVCQVWVLFQGNVTYSNKMFSFNPVGPLGPIVASAK